jgi:S-formylglutathione hydrolase FrmB
MLAGVLAAAWNEAGRPEPPPGFAMTDRLMPFAPPFTPPRRNAAARPAPVAEEVKQAARARTRTITVPSALLKRGVSVNLLLPRGYAPAPPACATRSCICCTERSGRTQTGTSVRESLRTLADLPLIVVMPDAGNSFYVNAPGPGRHADFFLRELVPHIDKGYRTIARREGRAIAGLSMGGYGAWRLALESPQTFACAASLSGALLWGEGDFHQGLTRTLAVPLYGGEGPEQTALFAADRLLPLLEKRAGGGGRAWNGPALYFDIGTDDPLLSTNRLMEQRLLERRIPYLYAEYTGKHDWAYWDEHVRDALQFVLRHLSVPAAPPRPAR